MRLFRKITVRVLAALLVLLVIAVGAGVMVLRSGWFREQVRARIVVELERATGGAVDLGQFSFDWKKLTADVGPLVIHGKEPASEQPFLRVAAVSVGLRIISAMEKKVDLASLRVDQPLIRIVVYPDGSTNVPSPGRSTPAGNWAQQLIALRVASYEISNGVFEFDERRTPLNLRGEDLQIGMTYEASGPSYRGTVSSRRVQVSPADQGPIEASVAGTFTLDKDKFTFPQLDVTTAQSRATLQGTLDDVRAPHGVFDVKANINVGEWVRMFNLPVGPQGSATFGGKITIHFGTPFSFAMSGRATAAGLGYMRDRLKIEGATLRTDLDLVKDRLTLRSLQVEALGAEITGNAELADWKQFRLDGQIDGMDLRKAAGVLTDRAIAWDGTLSGPVHLTTSLKGLDAKIRTTLAIAPGAEGMPVEGVLDATYDQAERTLALGSSWVATQASRLELSGTLGQQLRVNLRTSDPQDLLPAIAMVEANPPASLPLQLNNGMATMDGTVTGALDDPHYAGQATVTNGSIEGHGFDRVTAQVEADKTQVRAERITLTRGSTEVTGSASIAAKGGAFDDGAITAALSAKGLDIAALVKEVGANEPVSGIASATVRVTGSVMSPDAEVVADVAQPEAFGEQFSRLRTTLHYKRDSIEIASGDATDGQAIIRFTGSYRRVGNDWKSGEATWDASTQNLPLGRIDHLARLKPAVEATLTGRVRGSAQLSNGELLPRTVTADLAANGITIDKQLVGSLSLGIETRGQELQLLATGKLRESIVEGRGTWTLAGNYPGSGTARFSRITLASLHELTQLSETEPAKEKEIPFEGYLEGHATFSAPLRSLKDSTAEVTLDTVQVNPKQTQVAKLGVQPQDTVLKNEQPVVVDITAQEIRVRDAHFTGRDTSLQATGAIPLRSGADADLTLRGNINLILLQLYNPDLLARGDATLQASIRGSIQNPAVNGRLEVKGASLYFSDLPNGIDNANGSILFDRNRATIERLTAQTGGGTLTLTGLVEFGKTLTYRLQATAQQVRVRWPEDLSTTYNARLGLVGTTESSTLSGVLTLTRAAFNPRTDLGQLLAQASKPVPAPSAPSDILRGLQFDVRIESGPNFTFETSLTRDVEAEVDLNLHGTPLRPVLLGNITVNQGEVQVFGNQYTIDRGEVHFLNPVKIEPSFDMNLETRARGITVNVSFSGTVQQLKVNYSSDPPLQSSEIIALLAVGRDPTAASANSTAGGSTPNSGLVEAGSSLLGQAVNAQISSRLQRFFGASRVKIDPTLTGVDNLPQARLTIEQQVSKDITFTYITNLNRTQEQVVRVQWDFNRQWSAVAVRDESGFFGIDFQYRKRF